MQCARIEFSCSNHTSLLPDTLDVATLLADSATERLCSKCPRELSLMLGVNDQACSSSGTCAEQPCCLHLVASLSRAFSAASCWGSSPRLGTTCMQKLIRQYATDLHIRSHSMICLHAGADQAICNRLTHAQSFSHMPQPASGAEQPHSCGHWCNKAVQQLLVRENSRGLSNRHHQL